MNIRPSAAIRQNYNEIADLCRKTAEPVYLTKNGEGDLVVMDIETFARREKMLKLREELLAVEEDRLHGARGYSIDEVTAMMRAAAQEAVMQQEKPNKYRVVVSEAGGPDARFLRSPFGRSRAGGRRTPDRPV